MSTSIHSGLVDFAGSLYGAAADPADTVLMRDGVANGLLHAADCYGQVRVNYCPTSIGNNARDTFETIESGPTAGEWYELGGQPFDTWPLTCHANGTPYLLRIRLGVAASSTSALINITWRVVLAGIDRQYEELHSYADHVWEATLTASQTAAWATGATRGSAAHVTVLELDASRAASWVRRVSTFDAVSGGSPTSVEQVLVGLYVFAKTTNASALPRLHALHATEYVGT